MASWLLLLMHGTACNGLSQRARPELPTANDTLEEKRPECGVISDYATPLVVDLDASSRGDMELAMRESIGVVVYDCDRLELLRDCTVDGSYGFMGYETKEEVVRLNNSDELYMNLPFGGKALGAKLGGALEREASIDIAMMMIGKHRTTRKMTTRDQLIEGRPGACKGATHFIRGATLGAFAMTSGSKAQTRAAAEILGASLAGGAGKSEKSLERSSGTLAACKAAHRDAEEAPVGCSAIVRLELTAVDEGAAADNGFALDVCNSDYVLSQGKCTKPAKGVPHLCKPKDYDDCERQCEAGDAPSCGRVAYYHLKGEHYPKDEKKAAELFRQTCDANYEIGCATLGSLYVRGVGVERDVDKGVGLIQRACEAGDARFCGFLGKVFYVGNRVRADKRKAAAFAKLACYGGDASGCFVVGELYRKGAGGLPRDAKKARAHYQKGCVGGDALACYALAVAMQEGIGGPKDNPGALKLFGVLCDKAKLPAACKEVR